MLTAIAPLTSVFSPHERASRGVQIARGVDGDTFAQGAVGRIGLVSRNEHGHFAVFEAPDPDPPLPARVNLFRRF